MQIASTRKETGWFSVLRGLGAILIAFGLVLSGCDSNGSTNGGDPPPDDGGNGDTFSVPHYDTSGVDGGADVITVSDAAEDFGVGYEDQDGNAVTEITWSSDFIYKLDGFVFVEEREELNIDPGTIIKGLPGSGEDASALIVDVGGQIFADGNPGSSDPADAEPIIFTADADPVTPETAPGGGLGRTTRGEWGGVILLGDATINSEPPTTSIEGVPTTEERAIYGAENGDFNDDHNVGVFRFVSIRHTGTVLGSGSEIQGLTMGGVGSGSTIEYVESYASDDDGYEWFGGTVNAKYLISAWVSDDAFDLDEGFRGSNQFALAVYATDIGGRAAEHDGGTDPESGEPFATAKFSNATYIGMGPETRDDDVGGDGNNPFLVHRDNNATSYFHSVFMDARITEAGLQIEDLESGEDSRERWLADELRHENNFWFNIGPDWAPDDSTTFESIIQLTTDDDGNPVGDGGEAFRGELADYLRDNGNQLLSTSPIQSIDRSGDGVINSLDPTAAGPAAGTNPQAPSGFGETGGENSQFTPVNDNGAVTQQTGKWYEGWTLLSQDGVLQ
ncbi:MAG: hypothetical protein BRD30_05920 [Bacteroidetes bacterium QH_2_63_10]|nr:MAG: hypothetical protein BRD30_05920 [Bacteroidetes bacterium QH_2_63_10]